MSIFAVKNPKRGIHQYPLNVAKFVPPLEISIPFLLICDALAQTKETLRKPLKQTLESNMGVVELHQFLYNFQGGIGALEHAEDKLRQRNKVSVDRNSWLVRTRPFAESLMAPKTNWTYTEASTMILSQWRKYQQDTKLATSRVTPTTAATFNNKRKFLPEGSDHHPKQVSGLSELAKAAAVSQPLAATRVSRTETPPLQRAPTAPTAQTGKMHTQSVKIVIVM
jgi:hypothetical protein